MAVSDVGVSDAGVFDLATSDPAASDPAASGVSSSAAFAPSSAPGSRNTAKRGSRSSAAVPDDFRCSVLSGDSPATDAS